MDKKQEIAFKILGTLGLLIGPLFLPIVFSHVFAVEQFGLGEILASGTFAFCLVALSVTTLLGIIRSEKMILLFFALYALLSVELVSRLIIKGDKELLKDNIAWAKSTFENEAMYKGHPFLQFTGSEKTYHGFPTATPSPNKNKTRVVAIGGSTTASGYPHNLQKKLGEAFEVLNFGQAFYTSAHSMLNYFLNVVDLAPDFLIIHQGWNDNLARNTDKKFRGDYSHALKTYELPFIPDLYLIRFSALYRYLKNRFTPFPNWRFIDSNLQIKRVQTKENYNDLTELKPFKRNIKNIIVNSIQDNSTVILTTQPFVSKGEHFDEGMGRHIEQCNQIMRKLAKKYSKNVLLVDLYELMQRKHDKLFTDFAHLNEAGRALKAQHIGDAILNFLEPRK